MNTTIATTTTILYKNTTSKDTTDIMNKNFLPLEILYLILMEILILIGNSLVILAFAKGPRSIRTYTNYYVVNLAVTDLLVGLLSLPYWISFRLGFHDENLDAYWRPLDLLFGITSIFSLAVISLERMFAVTFPIIHRNYLSRRLVYISISITWIISITLSLINIFQQIGDDPDPISIYITFIAGFILPLVIITASYIVLFRAAATMELADNEKSVKNEMRIAKTISVIIGLFVIFWAPFFGANITLMCCAKNLSNLSWQVFTSIAKALHYSNSMMNFFVYAVRSPDFQATFKALVFNRCNTMEIRDRVRLLSVSVMQRNKTPSSGNNNTLQKNGKYSGEVTSEENGITKNI